jgi:Protein of unknown function (DUF3341)
MSTPTPGLWGLLGEFASAEALLDAARRARAAGFIKAEAYSPFPVEGLAEVLGFEPTGVGAATLVGALLGGTGAYFLQWYSATLDYPIAVGGRPLHSWPMFVPVTFEMTVLAGALAAIAALFVGSRLPRLHHPLFAADDFELASRNRFFLCLRSDDPAFVADRASAFLETLKPLRQSEVRE